MVDKIILSILSGLIGFFSAYILKILFRKDIILEKLVDKTLTDKFDKLLSVIASPGLNNILNFFSKKKPDDILKTLEGLTFLNENISKQKDHLEKINRFITSGLFNELTGKIHDHIESNEKFISRLNIYKESKLYLKDNFIVHPLIQNIFKNEKSIFIESGSTLGYLIMPLIENLSKFREDFRENYLTICTNNIVIYMLLLFQEYISPILLPGKPINQYAATFGVPFKKEKVDKEKVEAFLDEHQVNALFTTASFLDIKYGPHVSSKPNWEIKRILNKYSINKNIKNIFVITSEKINNEVSEKKIPSDCKLIFDDGCTPDVSNNPKALEKAHEAFQHHLENMNNIILTGSAKAEICAQSTETLTKEYKFLDKWELDQKQGKIALIKKHDSYT